MRTFFKAALTAFFLFCLFSLQSALAHRIAIHSCTPNLLPYAVAAVTVLHSQTAGAWSGFLSGTLLDLYSPLPLGIRMTTLFFSAAASGHITRKFLRPSLPAVFLFGIAISFPLSVAEVAAARIYPATAPLSDLISRAAGNMLYSLLVSPIAVLPFLLIRRVFPSPERTAGPARAVRLKGPGYHGSGYVWRPTPKVGKEDE